MEHSLLKDLKNNRDDYVIKIRICRMWECLNTKKGGELISLDMILIDEKETLMHASVHKNLVPRFRHLLSEGVLYCLKKFEVIESKGNYRPLSSKYKICFLTFTFVKKLEEDVITIPINGFEFISQSLAESRVNDDTILSDVVGLSAKLCQLHSVPFVSNLV